MTTNEFRRLFDSLMKPLKNRVYLLVGRALLHAVNDGGKLQTLQISMLAGETRDGAERVQNYGLTSVPPAGALCVALNQGGNRDHPLVIAVDHPGHRKSGLKPGEVAVYSQHGQHILLREDGAIELVAAADGDLICKAGETLRLEGKHVEVIAAESWKHDTNGYGQKWIYDGGAWKTDSWTTGASAGATHAIDAPEYEPSGVAPREDA